MKPADAQAIAELGRVQALRQAMRDAPTLPARFAALCEYQGALAVFVDLHWARIEDAFRRQTAGEGSTAPPDPRLTALRQRADRLERDLMKLREAIGEPV